MKLEQEMEEIFQRYLEAAEQGDMESQYKVGLFYCNGLGVADNKTKAFEW